MKRLVLALAFVLAMAGSTIKADDVKVVVPTVTNSNYAFYPAITGVFLRLDTRDGKVDAIVPSKPTQNRVLTPALDASGDTAGRFELYPTANSWEWVVTDKITGEMWLLKWANKKKDDILKKVSR